MKRSQAYPWGFIFLSFIVSLILVAPELRGRTVFSLGTASNGSHGAINSEGSVAIGSERKFSWEGVVGYTCMDLLEEPRQSLALSATVALDIARGQRISMGDLGSLPALRLLLNPLEFPYSNLPKTYNVASSMGKIQFFPKKDISPLDGMAYVFAGNREFHLTSFIFNPVFTSGGARGGGFVSIFSTSTGKLELGGCHSVRTGMLDIPDEIPYGRFPFSEGTFLRVMLRSNPLAVSLIRPNDFMLQTLVNLSYSHDPKLGGGMLQGMSFVLNVGLLKVVWETQSLPQISGSPSSRIPSGDTYLQARKVLELSCTSRFLQVDWKMNEKLWYIAPYSASYQKKTYATTAKVTYSGSFGSLCIEQSSDISWNDAGDRKCTMEASISMQTKIGGVLTKLTPTYNQTEGGDPRVSLLAGFQGQIWKGISWGGSIRAGQKSTTLAMKVIYTHGKYRFQGELDELRRLNFSLTIDR